MGVGLHKSEEFIEVEMQTLPQFYKRNFYVIAPVYVDITDIVLDFTLSKIHCKNAC